MRFKVYQKPWRAALKVAAPFVAKRSSKKVFECVRLSWGDGSVLIEGTDMEGAVRLRLAAETDGSGVACVPLTALAGSAKGAGKDTVLSFDEAGPLRFGMECAGSRQEAACVDPAEYPTILDGPAAWRDCAELGVTLCEAAPFCGKEAARFILNGMQLKGGVSATDGRRLYWRPLDLGKGEAIIPPRYVHERIDGVAFMSTGAARNAIVAFRVSGLPGIESATIIVRGMEGVFPDPEQIVPKNCPQSCGIDAKAWASALKAVRPMASFETQSVACRFDEGTVTFRASCGDGTAEASAPQSGMNHGFKVGFNPSFMLDCLAISPDRFGGKNENGAWKFTGEGGRVAVLMPVVLD